MKRAMLAAAVGLVAAGAARCAARNAGATAVERHRPLAGDEAAQNGGHASTMATTIDAPPEAVWPWLVQMGCGRGGWYSWDRLDNGGTASAAEIRPELQDLKVGDRLPSTPDGRCWFEVVELEPERKLVLRTRVDLLRRGSYEDEAPRRAFTDAIWAFMLERDGDRTRLLVRSRGITRPRLVGLLADAFLFDPAHFVMERRQLHNLARLAAAHYNASEPVEEEPVTVGTA